MYHICVHMVCLVHTDYITVPDTHPKELRTKSGRFFIMGNKEHSQSLGISEQIANLRFNNLIIEDEEEAARILNHVSYYRLIKAYGKAFKNKNGRYHDGTSFAKIWSVYEFDNDLRLLLIPYIQKIEITLRCRIANYFCKNYGVLGYLDSANFDEYCNFSFLEEKINKSIDYAKDSPIIKNFKFNYVNGTAPLYAVVEIFSLGTLIKFYESMKPDDRKYIAKLYGEDVDDYYLISWLDSINYLRNLCSHFNRLYKQTVMKKPKLYKRQDGEVNNNTIFSILCCMRYLLAEPEDDWISLVGGLEDILRDNTLFVKESDLGFIPGWKAKLLDHTTTLFDLAILLNA